MKYKSLLTAVIITFGIIVGGGLPSGSALAYTQTRLLDDQVLDKVGSITQQQISDFLAGKTGPFNKLSAASPCLNTYQTPNFAWDGSHWHYGDVTNAADPLYANSAWNSSLGPNTISAAGAIFKSAQQWGLNPEVILATLEKEESLVSGNTCTPSRYNSAMGYDCPDQVTLQDYQYINIFQTCVRHEKNAGFSKQVLWGGWQLKFNKERSLGHTAWDGDGDITYVGYMTQGTFARCAGCNPSYFNGNATVDGQTIYLETGATASLYTYTPHLGQSFPGIFQGWFGSTLSGMCIGDSSVGNPGTNITDIQFGKIKPRVDAANFIIYSGSSTNCIEAHSMSQNFGSWQQHTASNFHGVDPANTIIRYADLTGSGIDEPILIGINNTSSGMVEFHVWDSSMQQWIVHTASNLPIAAMTNTTIEFADLDGNGIDEPVAISYRGTTTNMVEFHFWNSGLQSWRSHVVSNLPVINPANMQVRFADLNRDGRDEAIAIGINGTSTSMAEFHVWNPGLATWQSHYVSNLPVAQLVAGDNSIEFGDIDGDGRDEGIVVGRRNTSSGMIEFHIWNPGFGSWKIHYISPQSSQ